MNDTSLSTFMVVCEFREGVSMEEISVLIPAEQATVATLRASGRIGSIYLALSRRTVFIEAKATGADDALALIRSLPMATLWEIDVYPTEPPPSSVGPR